jgi:hypothetical protein
MRYYWEHGLAGGFCIEVVLQLGRILTLSTVTMSYMSLLKTLKVFERQIQKAPGDVWLMIRQGRAIVDKALIIASLRENG